MEFARLLELSEGKLNLLKIKPNYKSPFIIWYREEGGRAGRSVPAEELFGVRS